MKNFEKYKTAEERAMEFSRFCKRYCAKCPLGVYDLDYRVPTCLAYWLDLEVYDEEPLPCPFCGRDTKVVRTKFFGLRWQVRCKCGYSSDYYRSSIDDAIAAHNRVAKAVMDAKVKEANDEDAK